MKRVKFNSEKLDNGSFQLYVGNATWFNFPNKTKLEKFNRDYARIINDNILILNTIQPFVNYQFRTHYAHLSNELCTKIIQSFSNFDVQFQKIFKVYSAGNHNAFVFANIRSSLQALEDAANLLYDFAKRYKHYGLKSGIQAQLKVIKNTYTSLENDRINLETNFDYVNP